MQAILGTRVSGDINLIAQLLMITGLWIGFYFAHTHQIPKHRNMQTTVVLVNTFFILFVMITSFYNFVILGDTTGGTIATLMIIHGTLGLIAELTGIYLILRMRTQIIPPRFRVRNFKLVMRSLITLWTVIVVLGLGIYYFRYLAPKPTAAASSPVAQLKHDADTLAIHADELAAAAGRNNLATTRRHAEHLVNLIVGKNSGDYGDLDNDGFVEDPGDGTGTLNYLKQVRDDAATKTGNAATAANVADQVRAELLTILADAKTVVQVSDLNAAAPQVSEIVSLSQQVFKGSVKSVPQIAELLNASTARPTVAVGPVPTGQNTVTVNLKDFQFAPKTVTIQKGTTIIFVNQDDAKHTATEDTSKFNSKDIDAGKTFSFTFNDAGTFPYHCEFHGDKGGVDMAGTIVVQ